MLTYAIDFGTSNSLLAAADEKTVYPPIILDNEAPDPTILRSLLYFPHSGKCFYGNQAIREFQENQGQGRLIRSIKKKLPVRSFVGTWIEDRPANLEDLIGFFLRELRERANRYFNKDVRRVLLGRPAKFSEDEMEDKYAQFRLEQAARRAGFEEIFFCAEPLAAAYEFASTFTQPQTVLVADFGGGTSDFTVIRIQNSSEGEVLSLGGVNVAGDKLDGAIMRHRLVKYFGSELRYRVPFGANVLTMPSHLMEKLCSAADISLLAKRDAQEFLRNIQKWAVSEKDRNELERLSILIRDQLGFPLFECIEGAKRALSSEDKTRLIFDYPGISLREALGRSEFETMAQGEIGEILACLDKTVEDSRLNAVEIDLVCCTGGTARVPAVQKALVDRFGAEKIKEHRHFHSVVQGLAYRARDLLRA